MDSFKLGDPRPVFDGAWNGATVAQREAHNARVRAWKAAQGIALGARTNAQSGKAQSLAPTREEEQAAHLSVLQSVITSPNALASDRIRAVEARERILSRAEEEQRSEAHGELRALRDALDLLPPEERVGALGALLVVS